MTQNVAHSYWYVRSHHRLMYVSTAAEGKAWKWADDALHFYLFMQTYP